VQVVLRGSPLVENEEAVLTVAGPSDAPMQVAVVGCGAVAQQYYGPALQELAGRGLLEVVALYDPAPSAVAQLQQHFPAARSVKDLSELSAPETGLAIVASPPRYHAAHATQLLSSGLSVLCEKPMASTVADAEAMIAAADISPGVLAIGMSRRFFPSSEFVREILQNGVLGDLVRFRFSEGDVFRWPVQSPRYFVKGDGNGGVLMDIGVHALDLMLWWMGDPLNVVYEDDAMGGIEANCRLRCTVSNGVIGEVRLSRDCVLENRYTIIGSKGWLSWNVNDASRIEMGFGEPSMGVKAEIRELEYSLGLPTLGARALSFEGSFVRQLASVVEAARGAGPLRVPGEQGIRSIRLIEECYRKRSLMAMPWMSSAELATGRALNNDRSGRPQKVVEEPL
jgi:predicted dehydrogenase